MIILTSDGVIEAMNTNRELLSFERLERIVKHAPIDSAEDMLQHINDEVLAFIGNAKLHDDLTIVVVRI